jgi:23S rRNA pseudouridine2605 synthase
MPIERLQKIIAAAGIASRRKAEELIQQGLVSVNGQPVTELGSKADPDADSIRVSGKLLKGAERHEYVALNKPRGYVTTVSDPEGRPTVMELVRSKARLYPIGRLDFNSEGLLLLTNDGDLAHKLMKAASHIPKTYLVKVAGQPEEDQLRRLRAGVSIAEERNPARRVRTAAAQIRIIKEAENPWLEVTLHEGRNRQIRKMFEEIGHHVEKIRRIRYGPLELDLPPGESRVLSPKEVSQLQRATLPQVHSGFERQGARDSRLRKRPDRESRSFERRPDDQRTGGEKSDRKDGRFPPRRDRPQRGAPGRRFERREDRPRPDARRPQFAASENVAEPSSKPFTRRGRPDSSRNDFEGKRRPKFGGQSDRRERSSRPPQFGERPKFGGRPNRSSGAKPRSRRPGPNRSSGR